MSCCADTPRIKPQVMLMSRGSVLACYELRHKRYRRVSGALARLRPCSLMVVREPWGARRLGSDCSGRWGRTEHRARIAGASVRRWGADGQARGTHSPTPRRAAKASGSAARSTGGAGGTDLVLGYSWSMHGLKTPRRPPARPLRTSFELGFYCAPGRNRTCDRWMRSPELGCRPRVTSCRSVPTQPACRSVSFHAACCRPGPPLRSTTIRKI